MAENWYEPEAPDEHARRGEPREARARWLRRRARRRARRSARRGHPWRPRHDPPARHRASGARGRARLLTLLAIIGPGLIVMVGDNDAGGVATYSQAGQNYGTSLLWVAAAAGPGPDRQPGDGRPAGSRHRRRPRPAHQGALRQLLGPLLGRRPVRLDFLTIVTEFIGVDLALGYFGVSKYLSVPAGGTRPGRHHRIGQLPPLGALHAGLRRGQLPRHPARRLQPPASPARSCTASSSRASQGGFNSTSVLLIIAIVGTTVAPWQLFFQQSNIVDKRITPRWINYERADTVLGSLVTVVGASGDDRDVRLRLRATRTTAATSRTPAASPVASATSSGTRPARSSRSCCSTPRSSAPQR